MTPQAQDGLYTSASVDERTHELIVKAINVTPMTRAVNFDLTGASPSAAAKLITLANADLKAENSFDRPRNVSPEYSTVEVKSGLTPVSLRPYSVTVYRIRVQ